MNILSVACLLSILVFGAEAVCKTGTLTEFEQAALDIHNELRGLHENTEDLCYGETGDDISFYAQTWADEMASSKSMSHSTSSQYYDSSNPYGENLAYAGTTQTVAEEDAAYESSTQAWYNEISDWDFSTSASTGGVTGHFTQVVWQDSEQVNCGYATFYDAPYNSYYVVCQYYPAGNWQGQYADSVQPLNSDDSNDTDEGEDDGGDSDGGDSDGGDSDDEECSDATVDCETWATNGYCDTGSYVDYMAQNCPASCGLCTDGSTNGSTDGSSDNSTNECYDLNNNCEYYQSSYSHCNNTNSEAADWMAENCPATCGLCNDGSTNGSTDGSSDNSTNGNSYSFSLVNSAGEPSDNGTGLLIATINDNVGTVCDDRFSNLSASAICNEMGFNSTAISWQNGYLWSSVQGAYEIVMDNVNCLTANFAECTYDTSHNCGHSEDVFLSCDGSPIYNGTTDNSTDGSSDNSTNVDECNAQEYFATAEPQRLTSPNYPNNYTNNIRSCISKIYADEGQQIQLNFEEFDIEYDSNCSYDYVEVRDGDNNSTSPLLGRFCGNSTPGNIYSSGNSLLIKFHSDGSVVKTGFLAHFTAFDRDGDGDDDGDGDSEEGNVVLRLRGSDSMGVVLASADPSDNDSWAFVCSDGVGRKEVRAICRNFGYNTGIRIDPYSMDGKYDLTDEYGFGATDLSCPSGADDPNDCEWTEYAMADVPCVDGQQLAVSCADTAWEFEISNFTSKVNRKGKAKFECSAWANRYGMEWDMRDNAASVIYNRDSSGNYTMVIDSDDVKYKKKSGYWKSKGWVDDIPSDDRCFICVAVIKDIYLMEFAIDSDCSYRDEVWSEIMGDEEASRGLIPRVHVDTDNSQ